MKGRDVVPVVSRIPGGNEIGWSIKESRIDAGAFDGIDAVIHLAGAGIGDHRWRGHGRPHAPERQRSLKKNLSVP